MTELINMVQTYVAAAFTHTMLFGIEDGGRKRGVFRVVRVRAIDVPSLLLWAKLDDDTMSKGFKKLRMNNTAAVRRAIIASGTEIYRCNMAEWVKYYEAHKLFVNNEGATKTANKGVAFERFVVEELCHSEWHYNTDAHFEHPDVYLDGEPIEVKYQNGTLMSYSQYAYAKRLGY